MQITPVIPGPCTNLLWLRWNDCQFNFCSSYCQRGNLSHVHFVTRTHRCQTAMWNRKAARHHCFTHFPQIKEQKQRKVLNREQMQTKTKRGNPKLIYIDTTWTGHQSITGLTDNWSRSHLTYRQLRVANYPNSHVFGHEAKVPTENPRKVWQDMARHGSCHSLESRFLSFIQQFVFLVIITCNHKSVMSECSSETYLRYLSISIKLTQLDAQLSGSIYISPTPLSLRHSLNTTIQIHCWYTMLDTWKNTVHMHDSCNFLTIRNHSL